MRFLITDNLPDLSRRVYKEELNLLMPRALNLLLELTEEGEPDIVIDTEEENVHESGTIRAGIDLSTG